jgi:NAD(P)-dependent dehydrogenase (short-subunit alcohol dehydrogenase family)
MAAERQRTAVVSGGGTGIGLAVARRLLADGYAVTAVGIDREADLPAGLTFAELDVTDDAAVAAFASGRQPLDALVNAAGMIAREGREFTMAGFRRVIDVNLNGTASLCFALRDGLKAAGGAVVNIASMYALFGAPGTPAYAASKGAIVQLTKSLAVAWAPDGIRVNAVAPGWIETRLAAGAKADEARNRRIMDRLPIGRWGSGAEVADVIAFLLSDAARYVNGAVYAIDGGYSAA